MTTLSSCFLLHPEQTKHMSLEFAVRCPRCAGQAVAVMVPVGRKGTYREVYEKLGAGRIICGHCGLSRDAEPGGALEYELWYVTQFEGHRLWANNRRHLDFLIDWLSSGADVRRADVPDRGYLEALPKWLRTPRHRTALLVCLRRLRGDAEA